MRAEATRCHVVIVTHDSELSFARCIEALRAQTDVALDIVVVDNGSASDPAGQLADPEGIRWIRNPGNPGFAVACNQGAATADADWLLFLNPDCLLPEGALGALLEVAAAQPGQGLLCAQLTNEDGRLQMASRRHAPIPSRLLSGRLELAPPAWDGPAGKPPGFEAVEAVSGALMLLPRALFEAVGGFDEGYRLHCEDLDLCRRVLAQGGWVGIAPRVRVPHLKGTSSRRRPFWVEWQKHRGMWRYYSKFDRARSGWWVSLMVGAALSVHYPLAALRAAWRARRAIH